MRRCLLMTLVMGIFVCLLPVQQAKAQIPILEIIKAAVVKAIKAADLAIQRIQNQTIKLQNAQKALENTLSKLKLNEIGDWVDKQREQYAVYYEELARVRNAIAYGQKVREAIQLQLAIVEEYRRAIHAVSKDANFTPDQVMQMIGFYTALVAESARSVGQLESIVTAFSLKMPDAARVEMIAAATENIRDQLSRLRRYTYGNALYSMQKTRDYGELQHIKALYGIK